MRNDSGNTGGEEVLVDLSAVKNVAAAGGGGEVLSVNSSGDADSSFRVVQRSSGT